MTTASFGRLAALVASLGVAPLALAQDAVTAPAHWAMVGMLAGFGMLFVLAIIAIVNFNEHRQQRDRLALAERLAKADKPVPPELLTGEKPRLPLAEERRHDVRRGITLFCWAVAVALIPVIGSGGEWRYGVWGLLFLLPSFGSFLKAHLTAREIARGASSGSP